MNRFIFHNVGQGLFYSGHIEDNDFNFIYDCGSISNRKFLNNAIDNQLPMNQIDFIVISHLDADHINGLSRIVKNYKVKKIYLPYLGQGTSDIIKLSIGYSLIQNEDKELRTPDEVYNDEFFREYTFLVNLFDIEKSNEYEFNVEYLGVNAEPVESSSFWYSSKSFSHSSITKDLWEFVMFNKRVSNSDLVSLNKSIQKELILHKVTDVTDLIKQGKLTSITSIYKKIFKRKLNLTSTILIHRPLNNTILFFPYLNTICNEFFTSNYCQNPVTILTGDAEFDSIMLAKLDKELKKKLDIFTIFQVPHHGAKTNWNLLTNKYKYIFNHYVIPFGLGRKSHPDKIVISNLSTIKVNAVSMNTELGYIEYYIG